MPPQTPFTKRLTLVSDQIDKVRALLSALIGSNPFYTRKFAEAGVAYKIRDLVEFAATVPFTTKQELVEDQRIHPPFGTNLTFPPARYSRCHQTSGTGGFPLRWLDTPESWDTMVRNWATILRTAGVTSEDRLFFAFSFGPFLGFWTAFEAASRLGLFCLPSGGQSSHVRLRTVLELGATVLCCTPSYAMRLAEVAVREGLNLSQSQVRLLIVAGEPGGSIPAVREHLSRLWPGARVYDHHGMTEVGPVTYECPARPCVLHVLENSYIPEIIDPATGRDVELGQTGELVLTTLFRTGSPLVRYRTGDLVKACPDRICECGRHEVALEGGILGRADDMVIVRGVNIFPSSVEEIVRSCDGVAEYQVEVNTSRPLVELRLQIEPTPQCPEPRELITKIQTRFEEAFALRVPVLLAPPGALPRFEAKASRWKKA